MAASTAAAAAATAEAAPSTKAAAEAPGAGTGPGAGRRAAELEAAARRVRALQSRARQLGLPAAAVGRRLAAARRAAVATAEKASGGGGACARGFSRGPLLPAVAGVLTATLALAAALGLHTHAGLSRALLRWQQRDVFAEECVLDLPYDLYKALRPPVDCAVCKEVDSVDRVHAISPHTFEQRYAYSGRPVVVTDAMTNWTAPGTFSFAYFKKVYERAAEEGGGAHKESLGCQFFPYETEFDHLMEALNMSEDRATLSQGQRPWYIGWSNCEERVARELRRHYGRPYFLPPTAETKRLDWIFMGSPGYGAHMHVDNVEHPSWQAQLRGRKHWILQPPPECFYECRNLEVTVETGEILVLDTNIWYHQTTIVSDDMSITVGAEYD